MLRLRVADDLAQVISCHSERISIPITELGSADLGVGDTLTVQVLNLQQEGQTGGQVGGLKQEERQGSEGTRIFSSPPRCLSLGSVLDAKLALGSPQHQTATVSNK